MKITKSFENGKMNILLEGRLDTTTAPDLSQELVDLEGVTELCFDFEKLEYISSAGLRVLFSAQKSMKNRGTMKVIHVCSEIMEVFDITGFTDILTIE